MSDIWPGNYDKFIGLKFKSNNQWHYGWLRISVPEDGLSVIIKDFAWETTPEQSINAGDGIETEAVLDYSDSDEICVSPNPAIDDITLSFPENQNISLISIFNSIGIEVKRINQTELNGNNQISISTADFPSGLYHFSFVNQTGRVTKSFVVIR